MTCKQTMHAYINKILWLVCLDVSKKKPSNESTWIWTKTLVQLFAMNQEPKTKPKMHQQHELCIFQVSLKDKETVTQGETIKLQSVISSQVSPLPQKLWPLQPQRNPPPTAWPASPLLIPLRPVKEASPLPAQLPLQQVVKHLLQQLLYRFK